MKIFVIFLTVLRRAVIASPEPVAAIATASFGEPMDANGSKVLGNSIIFSDIRGTEEANDMLG